MAHNIKLALYAPPLVIVLVVINLLSLEKQGG